MNIVDFSRRTYNWFTRITFQRLFLFLRRVRLLFFLKSWITYCGKNITVKGLPLNVNVHRRTTISENCVFEFSSESAFTIGDGCFLSYGVVISCMKKISIGSSVQIGEYTSIRDTEHQYNDLNIPIKLQDDISSDIIIGDDVWIGRGCMIFPGSEIGDGVIVGANSVVKGKLEDHGIYAGSPAKLIKSRKT